MASSSAFTGADSWPLTKSFLAPLYENMRTQETWIEPFTKFFNIIIHSDFQLASNDYSIYQLLHYEFALQARSDRLKFESDLSLPSGYTIPAGCRRSEREIEEISRQCRANAPTCAESLKQLAIETQRAPACGTIQDLPLIDIESRECYLLQLVEKRFQNDEPGTSMHYHWFNETIKHHKVLRNRTSRENPDRIDNASFATLVKHFGLRGQLNGVVSQAA